MYNVFHSDRAEYQTEHLEPQCQTLKMAQIGQSPWRLPDLEIYRQVPSLIPQRQDQGVEHPDWHSRVLRCLWLEQLRRMYPLRYGISNGRRCQALQCLGFKIGINEPVFSVHGPPSFMPLLQKLCIGSSKVQN